MRANLLISIACAVWSAAGWGAQQIACYEARWADTEVKLDGDLSESVWAAARAWTDYSALVGKGDVATLPTSVRFLYDAKGLYLGIVNGGLQPEARWCRHPVTDLRSAGEDDCAEIYIDPEAQSIGFMKFVANVTGGWCDYKRQDGQVVLMNWTAPGWRFKVKRTDAAWMLEAFFPWSDLGKVPHGGDVWRILHVRFHWFGPTHDIFALTSSPGGCYARPDCYGYLYFARPGEETSLETIGRRIVNDVPGVWFAAAGDETITCAGDGIVKKGSRAELLAAEKKAAEDEAEWKRKLEERFK